MEDFVMGFSRPTSVLQHYQDMNLIMLIQSRTKNNSSKIISHRLLCMFVFIRISLFCDIKIKKQ